MLLVLLVFVLVLSLCVEGVIDIVLRLFPVVVWLVCVVVVCVLCVVGVLVVAAVWRCI